MITNFDKIKNEFQRIKSLGFVKNNRPNNKDGGIGNTFEDYLGVLENNIKDADFLGFEVKSQREFTSSYISLFTKSPTQPKSANRYLKDTFGKGDSEFPELKALHNSIFANKWNTLYNQYKLKLEIDRENEKMILLVNDNEDVLISNIVSWNFIALQKTMKKMSSLFVVSAEIKIIDNEQYFYFNKAKIYLDLNFNKFLELLENGLIMFDIRIGVYKSGKRIGNPHDHGSGFRIKKENIEQLYNQIFELE